MVDILKALKDSDDPFDDGFDPDIMREAEARARELMADEDWRDPEVTPDAPADTDPVSPASASDVTAPSETSSAAMAPGLAASAAGQSLQRAGFTFEHPRRRQLADMLRARSTLEGMITRGDPPLSAASLSRQHQDEALRRLEIPARPQTWPFFMAWPPQVVLDRLAAPSLSSDQKAEMVRRLAEMNDAMLMRSRQINAWLQEHNPIEAQDWKSCEAVKASRADPHYGIRWATLLNPGVQDQSLIASVLSWGHCVAVTADGGGVRAHDESLSFERSPLSPVGITPQAVALAVREARNRGWGKLKMQGSHEFGQMAIKAAKEAGIEAEITYHGRGLMSWRTYKVKIMPHVPAPVMPEPEGGSAVPGSQPDPDSAQPRERAAHALAVARNRSPLRSDIPDLEQGAPPDVPSPGSA